MQQISVAIMMHPSREQFLPYLLEKLGPDVPVVMDRGKGIWDTRRRATLAFPSGSTHHLVVQDDALIGADFYTHLEEEVERHPDVAMNLYWGRRKALRKYAQAALSKGGLYTNWIHWGVGILLPTALIPDCINYCDRMGRLKNHDDTRIANFLKERGVPTWYPLPSLLDHRACRSIMENSEGGAGRTALYFIGE